MPPARSVRIRSPASSARSPAARTTPCGWPTTLENEALLDTTRTLPDREDADLMLSAFVTRDGRIQNVELLEEQARALRVKPEVVLAMIDAASRARFAPSQFGGVPRRRQRGVAGDLDDRQGLDGLRPVSGQPAAPQRAAAFGPKPRSRGNGQAHAVGQQRRTRSLRGLAASRRRAGTASGRRTARLRPSRPESAASHLAVATASIRTATLSHASVRASASARRRRRRVLLDAPISPEPTLFIASVARTTSVRPASAASSRSVNCSCRASRMPSCGNAPCQRWASSEYSTRVTGESASRISNGTTIDVAFAAWRAHRDDRRGVVDVEARAFALARAAPMSAGFDF